MKDYNTENEEFLLRRLIKISNPEKNKKTLFIWPEGIFYESNLQEIKKYQYLFGNEFSENHLIILGINNFVNFSDKKNRKYFNSLAILDS